MTTTWLRPKRSIHNRAMLAHLFFDEDTWFPWRITACGREIEAIRLGDEGRHDYLCAQCLKHEAKLKV